MRFLLVFIFSSFCLAPTFAHPPTAIYVTVNDVTSVNIVVTHPVSNPSDHYIKQIEVFLNGQKIIGQNFSLQAEKEN